MDFLDAGAGAPACFRRPDLYGRKPGAESPIPEIRPGKKQSAERRLSETLIIVVSIFGLIGLGYLTTRTGLFSTAVGDRLTEFVFTLAIPLLLFDTLATADFHGVSPWRIWVAYFVPFAIVWTLSHLMIRRVFGRDSRAGIVAGGSAAYSNGVLIGIPLVQATLGDEARSSSSSSSQFTCRS